MLLLRQIVALVVALAVIGKLAAPIDTVVSFRNWSILAESVALGLYPATIGVEVFVVTGLIAGRRDKAGRWFPLVGIVMLAVFCAAMVIEAVVAKPPSCGCFGSLKFRIADSFWFAIGRNLILMLMLLPSLAGWKRADDSAPCADAAAAEVPAPAVVGRSAPSWKRAQPGAFTIIELLVTIAIIAILITMVFPALRVVRVRADAAVIRNDLRSNVQSSSAYSLDHDDIMPAPKTQGRAMYAPWPDDPSGQLVMYFEYEDLWRLDFAGRYTDAPSFVDPPLTHTYLDGINRRYFYAAGCYSAPVFWNGVTKRTEAMLKAQPLAGITYPSQKAMFIGYTQSGHVQLVPIRAPRDPPPGALRDEAVPFGSADGSAALVQPDRLIAPDTRASTGGKWEGIGAPLHGVYTFDGIHGRDVR